MVSFLSDYGTVDEFVGVCKGVMLAIAGHLRFVDVTHEIPPHDVRAGALTLVRAVQYLPQGIVLAIVDPGVGTERRAVAVEVEGAYLVGPDNGLLAPAVAMLGGARRAVELTRTEHHLEGPGETFAGRDVFAPVVAHLANGIPLEEVGEPVGTDTLVPGLVPLPEVAEDGSIRGEVLWVDRFGNAELNVGPDDLETRGAQVGGALQIRVRDTARRARWVRAYGEAKPSELVVLVDSAGFLSLALDRASAAAALGLRAGSAVTVVPPGPGR